MFDGNYILIIGDGGHARAVADVMQSAGLMATPPVACWPSDLEKISERYSRAIIAVGQIKDPKQRINLYKAAIEANIQLVTAISFRAWLSSSAVMGAGTVVMHGAGVNANAQIGANCILNTNSLIEHDCIIGDHCHISTGAIVNGGVKIGMGTFIGSGARIKEGVTIGERKVIGMGEIVRRDIL